MQGNLDENMYCRVPDPDISLTEKGHQQAGEVGDRIRRLIEQDQPAGSYELFVYTSPYRRTKQTCADIVAQFPPGVRAWGAGGAATEGAGLWELPGRAGQAAGEG